MEKEMRAQAEIVEQGLSDVLSRVCARLRREGFKPAVPSDGGSFTAHHWAHVWLEGSFGGLGGSQIVFAAKKEVDPDAEISSAPQQPPQQPLVEPPKGMIASMRSALSAFTGHRARETPGRRDIDQLLDDSEAADRHEVRRASDAWEAWDLESQSRSQRSRVF